MSGYIRGEAGARKEKQWGKAVMEELTGLSKKIAWVLDAIYIQAKRWDEGIVGRPEIHKFVGALHGQRAKKGIFITTSDFSSNAREYVANIDTKIVLIDGRQLALLMIDNDVGVSVILPINWKFL